MDHAKVGPDRKRGEVLRRQPLGRGGLGDTEVGVMLRLGCHPHLHAKVDDVLGVGIDFPEQNFVAPDHDLCWMPEAAILVRDDVCAAAAAGLVVADDCFCGARAVVEANVEKTFVAHAVPLTTSTTPTAIDCRSGGS